MIGKISKKINNYTMEPAERITYILFIICLNLMCIGAMVIGGFLFLMVLVLLIVPINLLFIKSYNTHREHLIEKKYFAVRVLFGVSFFLHVVSVVFMALSSIFFWRDTEGWEFLTNLIFVFLFILSFLIAIIIAAVQAAMSRKESGVDEYLFVMMVPAINKILILFSVVSILRSFYIIIEILELW
jgi:hypothetical protein